MEIPETQVKHNQVVGLVTVQEGEADEEKLNEELRMVVNEKWDFQAKKIAGQEYLVVFPDKGTLETFSRVGGFELSIHKLKVKITKSSVEPATSSMLQTCWVRISNIPDYARDEAVAKALASLVGQPVAVDELSLVRAEPVRVKVNCRNPSAIRCSIEIFFNKVGHEVKFVAEGIAGHKMLPKGGPSGSGKDNDKSGRRDQWGIGDPTSRKRNEKFDRFGKLDREQESSHGDSQEALEDNGQDGNLDGKQTMRIAAYHPSTGVL